MDPIFFEHPDALRAWLWEHHDTTDVQWIGLHKKATGRASITWPELVDELLCYGWIDGLRRSIDDDSWAIRVTPRRSGSHWSEVNVRRARELVEARRMEPAGMRAFEARDESRTGRYSFEREHAELGEAFEAELRANEAAWEFWRSQPPGYRKTVTWWVVSAKRESTRRRRLAALIRDSAAGERIGPLRR